MNKRIYKFTVEGQYLRMLNGSKQIGQYKADFILPSPDSALSVIVSKLLDDKLRLLYPDYIKFRTHKLTARQITGPAPDRSVLELDVDSMKYEQLTDFCLLKDIPVDPFKYSNVQLAREAVQKSWDGIKERAREAQKDQAKNAELDELRKLNNIPTENIQTSFDSAPKPTTPQPSLVQTSAPVGKLAGDTNAPDDIS